MTEETYPQVLQPVLDTEDPRGLAEFYRQLLGLVYRDGDGVPADGPDERGQDWLVLLRPDGGRALAFQKVDHLPRPTWPDDGVPQQVHLDCTVPDAAELDRQHARVLALGGRLLFDRSDDEDEPLRVYADLSGHPFCIFVA